ncbi:MAG: sugar porter family MFS transporter, partial [Salinibacterium sp.]|nr:sugar porter family MFS transporter [Salinibacterium sp.]
MRVVVISAVAALGGFLFGFDTAVINGTVTALNETFGLDAWMSGFAVSNALIGAAIGALFAGPIADKLGRVPAMRIAAVLFAVSALGSGLPFGIWDFILYRFIGGVAVGAASVIAPAYIAEVAPAAMRGRLGTLQQLAIVTGIAVALFGNQFIAMATDANSAMGELWGFAAWKWMFWAELVPAVAYFIGSFMIPESPRHLVKKGDTEGARSVLSGIMQGDPGAKVDEIKASLHNQPKSSIGDLFGGKFGLLPIVWIGMFLSIFQQFVGINVVFYYSSLLWQSVGVKEDQALLNTTIGGITNLLTTFIAIALVDKIGRKPL